MCSACGSRDLVDVATPAGTALARQYHPGGVVAAPAPPPSGMQADVGRTGWIIVGLLLCGLLVRCVTS